MYFKVRHAGVQPRRILSCHTTVDVRTGFLQEKILFNGKEDFHQDLHAAAVYVENSQTRKSSSKTLNVVRGKNLIKNYLVYRIQQEGRKRAQYDFTHEKPIKPTEV